MCLGSIDKTKQVSPLSTPSIAPSVGSYASTRAAPALSSVLSPLPSHARAPRACSYASTRDDFQNYIKCLSKNDAHVTCLCHSEGGTQAPCLQAHI